MSRRTTSLRIVTAILVSLLSGTAAAAPAQQAPPQAAERERLAGTWTGVLQLSAIELRLVFHVELGDDGALTGTLDSPDQGAAGIPLSAVTIEGDRVRLAFGGDRR